MPKPLLTLFSFSKFFSFFPQHEKFFNCHNTLHHRLFLFLFFIIIMNIIHKYCLLFKIQTMQKKQKSPQNYFQVPSPVISRWKHFYYYGLWLFIPLLWLYLHIKYQNKWYKNIPFEYGFPLDVYIQWVTPSVITSQGKPLCFTNLLLTTQLLLNSLCLSLNTGTGEAFSAKCFRLKTDVN